MAHTLSAPDDTIAQAPGTADNSSPLRAPLTALIEALSQLATATGSTHGVVWEDGVLRMTTMSRSQHTDGFDQPFLLSQVQASAHDKLHLTASLQAVEQAMAAFMRVLHHSPALMDLLANLKGIPDTSLSLGIAVRGAKKGQGLVRSMMGRHLFTPSAQHGVPAALVLDTWDRLWHAARGSNGNAVPSCTQHACLTWSGIGLQGGSYAPYGASERTTPSLPVATTASYGPVRHQPALWPLAAALVVPHPVTVWRMVERGTTHDTGVQRYIDRPEDHHPARRQAIVTWSQLCRAESRFHSSSLAHTYRVWQRAPGGSPALLLGATDADHTENITTFFDALDAWLPSLRHMSITLDLCPETWRRRVYVDGVPVGEIRHLGAYAAIAPNGTPWLVTSPHGAGGVVMVAHFNGADDARAAALLFEETGLYTTHLWTQDTSPA